MNIKNKITGLIFEVSKEEAKRLLEEDNTLFELVGASEEDLKIIEEVKIVKPITLEDKITGEIDFDSLEWNKLLQIAKEYGIKANGKKREVLIKEMKEHAK